MTKRYGRNQRRAHRERIAQLEAEVQRLSSVGPGGWRWAPAIPGDYTLAEGSVAGSDDTTYEPVDGICARRAHVTVRVTDALGRALYNPGRINWRGISWRCGPPMLEDGQRGIVMTLELEATAPRNWTPADLPPHRRPR